MRIDDFDDCLDPVILKRGREYYLEGRVSRLKQTAAGWTAVVEGTHDYLVEVELEPNGFLRYSSCDCPYEGGEYCKHQAAVFYAMRAGVATDGSGGQKPMATGRGESLEKVLADMQPQQMMDIILELADQYEEIRRTLLLKYGAHKDEIKACQESMRAYIREAKRGGFIDRRRAAHAVKGVDLTLDKALQREEQGNYMLALGMGLAALATAVDMLQFCDDSDGWVGTAINDALGVIDEVVRVAAGCMDLAEQKKMLTKLIKESRHKRYIGWWDWPIDLLGSCIYLCADKGLRTIVETELGRLLEAQGDDSLGSSDYGVSQVKMLQLKMLELFEDPNRAEEFIAANMQYSDFRQKAIENALRKKDYEQVVQLCRAGEEVDRGLPGLVMRWRKYRYHAHEEQGDVDNQRELARGFVYAGEFHYYPKLKELYPPSQWPGILAAILTEFEKRSYLPDVYVQILIEENLVEHLLRYCQRNPAAILKLYEYLLPDYLNETRALFQAHIDRAAREADQRSKYKQVCAMIKTYKKACGELAARSMITELCRSYPRRPAFLDELGRI